MNSNDDIAAARARRKKLFAEWSQLKLCGRRRKVEVIINRVPRDYCEHITFWTDGSSYFLLSEPYMREPPQVTGLGFIEVPPAFSPHCGAPSLKSITPLSRAWLFGMPDDRWKLRSIEHHLIAALGLVPEWNEV